MMFIYGLIDPDTRQLRYIGQSIRGFARPISHWKNKRNRELKDHAHCWVRSVLKRGKVPEIEVIQECSSFAELDEAEDFWMEYFRMIGCDLTNTYHGGKGAKGMCLSQERKKAIGDFHRGKIESEETRRLKSIAHKGKTLSEQTRKKLSLSIKSTKEKMFANKHVELSCPICDKIFKRLKIHLRSNKVCCSLCCASKFYWQNKKGVQRDDKGI